MPKTASRNVEFVREEIGPEFEAGIVERVGSVPFELSESYLVLDRVTGIRYQVFPHWEKPWGEKSIGDLL